LISSHYNELIDIATWFQHITTAIAITITIKITNKTLISSHYNELIDIATWFQHITTAIAITITTKIIM